MGEITIHRFVGTFNKAMQVVDTIMFNTNDMEYVTFGVLGRYGG